LYIATYADEKPNIVTLPRLNSRLAAYLANFLSPINYPEAQSLLENLRYDSVCEEDCIKDILPRECVTFKQSLQLIHNHTEKSMSV